MNNSATPTYSVGQRVNGFIVLILPSTRVVTILHSHQLKVTIKGTKATQLISTRVKLELLSRSSECSELLSRTFRVSAGCTETRPPRLTPLSSSHVASAEAGHHGQDSQVPTEFLALVVCLHILSHPSKGKEYALDQITTWLAVMRKRKHR